MKKIPVIDLHPEALPTGGLQATLLACRHFLQAQWEAGSREVKLITGLGLHGDGTPRLRWRIEREVLPAFSEKIEHTALEQGGAVLVVFFKNHSAAPSASHLKNLHQEKSRQQFAQQEERLMVARQRYDQAWQYLREDDLRRAKLKVNQLLREFLPQLPLASEDLNSLRAALSSIESCLQKLGA